MATPHASHAPLGIHHVSINVTDTAAAVAFYTDVLGFTVRPDRPDFRFAGAWLNAGDQQVHLIEMPPPEAKGQHFALQVAELDATVAAIRAMGVTVSDPKPVATSRQSFLHDPSGNMVELHQAAG